MSSELALSEGQRALAFGASLSFAVAAMSIAAVVIISVAPVLARRIEDIFILVTFLLSSSEGSL